MFTSSTNLHGPAVAATSSSAQPPTQPSLPLPTRLHRSELAVPASNRRMLEKAPELGADVVMLDLEDSVAAQDKALARRNVVDALCAFEWTGCSISVRINALDTRYCYRDIVEVVEAAGHRVDTIMVPKVSSAGDVHLVATLLSQIEKAVGLERRIGIAVLIETAMGMVRVDEIAAACPERMEAIVFGVADYAASIQSPTTSIGGADPGYAILTDPLEDDGARERHWGDPWHYAMARIAVTCRAHGLQPIDGPFGDFADPQGYAAAARRALALGYEGKWAIHPAQIQLANEVFTPDPRTVEAAGRIITAMNDAAADGRGAVSVDGRLLDAASLRMAENVLAKHAQIMARQPGRSTRTAERGSEAVAA
ncbi:MAG: CoA ester lyase [Solirubrobacterales bacterium]|nr:CoA ester lyase [Solirubrobacterales bacterium]